ncbi:MAG: 2-C-methyl-D-erythritol 4-phosphate cytidylyltransferase [Eubacteriales bacterium]|nr:2-C-methyl-D-erythritol 4-phosphate cytidylyltransferase [Eubacteriales bacterium]
MADRCTAIVVAAGSGTRMGGKVKKQFLEVNGKPILAHTLLAFAASPIITDMIVVTGADLLEYVQKEIVDAFGIRKVTKIVPGGSERYESVYRGLLEAEGSDYVFIQDGVRPFVDDAMLQRGFEMARESGCAIAGVPSKDTVKIVDENGVVKDTPPRSGVWSVQTPQIFRYELIREAYDKLQSADRTGITDDAMVMERMGRIPVRMFMGDYTNIKITTPEDLDIAERFFAGRE